jgi:hypothetical protein
MKRSDPTLKLVDDESKSASGVRQISISQSSISHWRVEQLKSERRKQRRGWVKLLVGGSIVVVLVAVATYWSLQSWIGGA